MRPNISLILILSFGLWISFNVFGCAEKKYSELPARKSAEWVKNAVIYQANLRSFSKEGTFKAFEKRIPDLKKLGVSVISLLPVHPIGELNRKGALGNPFAIKDFYGINPEFGSLNDLQSLIATTHRQGLKIILGFVANQAAWDNRLIMEHPEWFIQNDEGAIVSPNPDSYDVAEIDLNQHEARKYIIAVLKYWINEVDVDGFSFISTASTPLDFWILTRHVLEQNKSIMMIADESEPEYHLEAFDVTSGWSVFHAVNNSLRKSASAFPIDDSLRSEEDSLPIGSLRLRYLLPQQVSDQSDSLAPIGNFQKQLIQSLLLFTLPGIPFIVSGEEIGSTKRFDLFDKYELDWVSGKEIKTFYEQLGALRICHPAIQSGSYEHLKQNHEQILPFIRTSSMDSILIIINTSETKVSTNVSLSNNHYIRWEDQFTKTIYKMQDSSLTVLLGPLQFLALVPVKEKGNQ
jgi:glycosidase